MCLSQGGAAGPAPEHEVLFLALNFVRAAVPGEGAAEAVSALEAAALKHRLLPTRTDVFGEHPSIFVA